MTTYAPVPGGPYMRKNKSVQRSMVLVMLALLPATAYGFYLYGWPSIILFFVTLASAFAFEVICLRIRNQPIQIFAFDGSAIVTAWLIAVSLPPWAPWWIGVLGSAIAIVIGKHPYGGLGQNVFNPAMVARVALLISFPLEMTIFIKPIPIFSEMAPSLGDSLGIIFGGASYDAFTSASLLGTIRTELGQGMVIGDILRDSYQPLAWMIGNATGSLGEGAALLLTAGGIFLIYHRVITWHIPVSTIASIAIIAALFHLIDATRYPDAMVHVFTGATFLTAFFIATDPVTSPMSPRGQLFFGAALGILIYILRTWSVYPEGASFAILIMNALTPMIDRYLRPRIFGRTYKGEPLKPEKRP